MSLLEDIFLEDETEEARALERIIEGDEYEDVQVRSDEECNSAEEAEEDKRRVDPSKEKTKRVVKNPRFLLNPARLMGPRGIQVIPEHFKDFKFKGKGHEKEDLDIVLKRLEHWAYRLYPKFKFEDCLKKIELLGKKRPVMVHLHKIRSGQISSDEPVIQKDSSDEETNIPEEDEFDKLLQQQIDIARSTPANKKQQSEVCEEITSSPLLGPQPTPSPTMTTEQKERMMRNRQLALERRLAKMKQNNDRCNQSQDKNSQNNKIENWNENYSHTNDHTDNYCTQNQQDELNTCNKVVSQANVDEIDPRQTDSVDHKGSRNDNKESNSDNEYSDSNVNEATSVHIPPICKQGLNEYYDRDEYIINNKQISSAVNDKNRNVNNEVNVSLKTKNTVNTQVVSVDIHHIESKTNRSQNSKIGDIFTDNHEHLIGDSVINSVDHFENGNKYDNVNNSNDHGVDAILTELDQTLMNRNIIRSVDVEMMDVEGL